MAKIIVKNDSTLVGDGNRIHTWITIDFGSCSGLDPIDISFNPVDGIYGSFGQFLQEGDRKFDQSIEFIVTEKKARQAISIMNHDKANDHNLWYNLTPWVSSSNGVDTFNCTTYVNKILNAVLGFDLSDMGDRFHPGNQPWQVENIINEEKNVEKI